MLLSALQTKNQNLQTVIKDSGTFLRLKLISFYLKLFYIHCFGLV